MTLGYVMIDVQILTQVTIYKDVVLILIFLPRSNASLLTKSMIICCMEIDRQFYRILFVKYSNKLIQTEEGNTYT